MSSFRQAQIKILEERLENLMTDYQAVNKQRDNALDEVNRVRLKRRSESLEQEILEAESELDSLQPNSAPAQEIPPNSEDNMSHPSVFISYSKKDEAEKEQLITHLGVLQQQNLLDVWNDDKIKGGQDWERSLKTAIKQADIGILLITANYLSSQFILNQEANLLLKRHRNEGLTLIPILAKPCHIEDVPWLAAMIHPERRGVTLWREGGAYADSELTELAGRVMTTLRQKKSNPTPSPEPIDPPPADDPIDITDLNFDQKMALGTALMKCQSIKDPGTRSAVLDLLPDEIKNNIAKHAVLQTEVINIINTCLQYGDGLQKLVRIIEFFDQGAKSVKDVKQLLEKFAN